ncbi:serine/threonine-protein kinase BRI1-like 1 isoform X2 [Hibiscus syriacus]|uniref:serine/threonine-protein kinase BRI1-like 1 isoform X2 n=1 Tax=Hibiscus syriacus TaxID=106335 RepID=UPI001924D655|nr:serine/threonine-protein kinase BRI1-like 1 isoform X2 [Hibiscus syriacus]
MKMGNFWVFQNQCMYLFFIFISLSNNFTLSLQQQNPSNEVMALLGFKQKSVAADPQGFLNDWRLESLTPCSWRGVSCSLHGKVNMLNFTGAGLTGCLHMDDLMVLDSLKHLHLSGNLFSGNFFPMLEFKNCANLVALNLSNNSLYGTGIPRSLINCQLLETLDVSFNKLEGKIAAFLGNLRNLKHLNLGQNTFSGNIPQEMGSMCGTLIELDLSGNELSGGFPETFKSCNGLQRLNLGSNQLSGNFLTTVISYLPSLQILQVPFNNISGFIPVSLINHTKLQVLDLSSNGFDGNIPSGLCSNSSLRRLLLADNFLSGTIPADIGNCYVGE